MRVVERAPDPVVLGPDDVRDLVALVKDGITDPGDDWLVVSAKVPGRPDKVEVHTADDFLTDSRVPHVLTNLTIHTVLARHKNLFLGLGTRDSYLRISVPDSDAAWMHTKDLLLSAFLKQRRPPFWFVTRLAYHPAASARRMYAMYLVLYLWTLGTELVTRHLDAGQGVALIVLYLTAVVATLRHY